MVKVTLMSQSEYAKHRGVSHVAVHKAIKERRIILIEGKIDPNVADIQWAANTRARAPSSPGAAAIQPAAPGEATGVGFTGSGAASADLGGEGGGDSYWNSRSRREQAEASMAEMKQKEMAGELIRADAVRSAWAGKITAARDALLQIPARLGPLLAAESDLVAVTTLLEAELRQVLADLSGVPTAASTVAVH